MRIKRLSKDKYNVHVNANIAVNVHTIVFYQQLYFTTKFSPILIGLD